MTREEAISLIKSAQLMLVNPTTNEPVSDLYEAFDMAIKSLEQKPIGSVLDKIRDEVCDIDDEIVLNPDSFYERKAYIRFSKVINIIDKYKTETEAAEQ